MQWDDLLHSLNDFKRD